MTIREGYWWRWSHARHHTLSHMAFRPTIGDVALMDPRIYQSKPMGLAATLWAFTAINGRLTRDSIPHAYAASGDATGPAALIER
jgi:fatty acid desaturase